MLCRLQQSPWVWVGREVDIVEERHQELGKRG
jgi:hypothetical protein